MLSPMATSVTGNTKDILATIIGLFAFGDVVPTVNLIVGLIVSLIGAMLYSYSKISQKNK